MTNNLDIAIVGTGKMGRHHAVAIQRVPGARLVAVADSDASSATALATDLRVPNVYSDFEKLLDRQRPDIVHICTSPSSHFALARGALEAGASVYVEKPFTETAAQAHELIDLAKALDRRVCAGHQLLFERPTLIANSLLSRIGKIQHVDSYYSFRQAKRQDGRPPLSAQEQLLDILPHPTYLLMHFLGVSAKDAPLEIHGLQADPRGSAYALVSLGGVVGTISVSLHARPVESFVRVVGTRGALTLDYIRGIVVPSAGGTSSIDKILDPYSRAWTNVSASTASLSRRVLKKQRSYPGLVDAFTSFYKHVEFGTPAPVSVENIARTAELCDAVRGRLTVSLPTLPVDEPVAQPTVAVTGGTGMLGKRVVETLVELGISPLALSRRLPALGDRVRGAVYATSDLAAGKLSLPATVTTVIHCAAETSGGWDAHQRNSIDATRSVLNAMHNARIPNLVYVSSLAVIASDAQQPLHENSPLEVDGRRRGPYVWGKLSAERIVADAPRTHGVSVRIIRPGPLVDARSFEPPGKLGRALGRTLVATGHPDSTIPACDVDLAARLIAWTATNFESAEPVLHALDPTPSTRHDLVARVLATTPVDRVVWLPTPLLAVLSGLAFVLQKVRNPRKPAVSVISAFSAPKCDTSRAADVVGRLTTKHAMSAAQQNVARF